MTFRHFISFLTIALSSICACAQVEGSAEYILSSRFKDHDGNNVGSGSMSRSVIKGAYPIKYHKDSLGHISALVVSANLSYAHLDNSLHEGTELPDEIFNGSLNVSIIRPLGPKWIVLASLGGGLFGEPHQMAARCLLFNGGALFGYRLLPSLTVGLGAGLTNSYGIPMVLPMLFVEWQRKGRFNLKVNMTAGLKISADTRVAPRWDINANLLEMNGMSAVVLVNDKSRIFSMTTMRSDLRCVYSPVARLKLYGGVGCAWSRTTLLAERKVKKFFTMFNHHDKHHFDPSPVLFVGLSYGMP